MPNLAPSAERALPLQILRRALRLARTHRGRWVAYTTHPFTGSDCLSPRPQRAFGGAIVGSWLPGKCHRLLRAAP